MIKHLLIVEFDLSKGGLVYGRIFATRSFTSVFRFSQLKSNAERDFRKGVETKVNCIDRIYHFTLYVHTR